MKLYVVRHPQTLMPPATCYGASDVPVDPDELTRVAALLQAQLPRDVPLYSSPLQRCALLAQALERQHGFPAASYDERLVEMHFGDWEYCLWPDIPRAEIDAWADNLLLYRAGGGENLLQFAERVVEFYKALHWSRQEAAIIICHAGVFRLLSACLAGLPLPETALAAANGPYQIAYGELIVLSSDAT